jgi:hypothetical protein
VFLFITLKSQKLARCGGAFMKLRQEDLKFQDSLGYIVRPWLK